jgi:hypothetical protein
MPSTPKVKLSDAIGAPIVSAYKAGGLGLAFLTLGASLLLAAFRWNDKGLFTYFILGVGTLLIFSTLTLFYFKDLKKLMNAHKGIQQNAELIDTIQKTALEMTELADSLQALVFKHAVQVKQAIEAIAPLIKSLPILGPIVEAQGERLAKTLDPNIVKTTENIKYVIRDLKTALIESDPSSLNKYLEQLHQYRMEVRDLLGSTTTQ